MRYVLMVLVLLVVGCSGPNTRFSVANGDDVRAEDVAAAAALWNAAGSEFDLTVSNWGMPGDVNVVWADLPARKCAETDIDRGIIRLGRGMSEHCAGILPQVIAHELGHYMAHRVDHTAEPGTIMCFDASHIGMAVTGEDVRYVEDGQ